MQDVKSHYETLLARHYTWMTGSSLADKVVEQKEILARLLGDLPPGDGPALDLGSGPGYQSFALADLGYSPVLAFDTSEILLAELEANRAGRSVTAISADIARIRDHVGPREARAAVCMGDTLTHLPDVAAVRKLFGDVLDVLQPGGSFVLTFRDLSTEVTGLDRFIPIRSDDDRIMTCFLEFDPETVTVHDLIHVRTGSEWRLLKSSYRKLRLAPAAVAGMLSAAGFEVAASGPEGRLHAIVARR